MLNPDLPTLIFKAKPFAFIKTRRNGTKIFGADDGSCFLRLGPADEIQKELAFHQQLITQGYPVPAIIESGEWTGGDRYYLETSAGEEKFGVLFCKDVLEQGAINNTTLNAFSIIVQQYLKAQATSETNHQDWDALFHGVHFDLLINELPHEKDRLLATWEKVKTSLADVPFVLCHGDFNAYNILTGGVIDFETAFKGPKGYDLVSSATAIGWFPTEGDFEFIGRYAFTPEQKSSLLNLQPETIKHFDTLFLLHSVWLVIGMQKYPKTQVWRYAKFQKLMDEYLNP